MGWVSVCGNEIRLSEVFCSSGGNFWGGCGCRACLVGVKPFRMLTVMWVPRFRLRAPLRGSTARQCLVLSLDFRYLCRSAQNDTEAGCCVSDTIFIRQSNIQPKRNDTWGVPRVPLTKRARSRTLQEICTSRPNPKLPPYPRHFQKRETIFHFVSGGDMGEVRGGSGRFGGSGDPYERGRPAPPRSSYTFRTLLGTKRRTLRGTTATSMSPQMPRSPSKFHTTSSGTSKRIVPLGKCAMLFCL